MRKKKWMMLIVDWESGREIVKGKESEIGFMAKMSAHKNLSPDEREDFMNEILEFTKED